MGLVTCSACGYLGRRPKNLVEGPIPPDLLEVSRDTRKSGVGPRRPRVLQAGAGFPPEGHPPPVGL